MYLNKFLMLKNNVGLVQSELVAAGGIEIGEVLAVSNSVKVKRCLNLNISIE